MTTAYGSSEATREPFVTRAREKTGDVRGRLRQSVDDAQALEAFHRLCRLVGQVVERLGGSPDRVDLSCGPAPRLVEQPEAWFSASHPIWQVRAGLPRR